MTVPPYAPGTHLPGLHGLRGVAALAVLVFHVTVAPNPGSDPPAPLYWLRAMEYGVQFFFVLSALVLLHTYAPQRGRPGWIPRYAIRRFFRIAPLYYVMCGLGAAIYGASGRAWLFNLSFLFNLDETLFPGIALAGWAVGVEMLFYATVPLILVAIRDSRQALWLALACLAVSVLARLLLPSGPPGLVGTFNRHALPSNLVFFAAGVVVFHVLLERRVAPRACTLWGWAGLALLALVQPPPSGASGQPLLVLWAAPIALVCAGQALAPSAWLCRPALQWLGQHSFSLYLVHPVIVLVLSEYGVYGALHAALGPWAVLAGIAVTAAAALPVAMVTFRAIEAPGQRLGALLARRIPRRR